MAEKKSPTATGAKKGKVRGAGTVTPKSNEPTQPEATQPGPGDESTQPEEAWKAGRQASIKGSPSRPPADYDDVQTRLWYEGYKSHANPQNGGRVEDIDRGYRGDY